MVWQGSFAELFIDGRWIAPAGHEMIDVVSPYTEEVIARVPSASEVDMDKAVSAAREAFDDGPWPRMTLRERMDVLRRLSTALAENEELAATVITDEVGCPISQSRPAQSASVRVAVDTFLDLAEMYPFQETRCSKTGNALVLREPVGVVAAIVPWNTPLIISVMKLVPALLAGCTTVLKPAPETPLNAYLLAELFEAAGLPQGVVNVVPAHREVSEHLVTHAGIDKVGFTGSTAAGQRIASLCGQNLRRVTLELGGKSAAVILDDADLAATVESLRTGSLRNSGQVCSLKTRLLVSRAREAEFVDRLTAMIAAMPIGDPHDPATQIGPMVTARQRDRVEGYIGLGRSEGAKIVLGGGRPASQPHGWFVEPTVFTEVQPSMRIAQEEIFGPVLSVITYDDEDQAVAIANDSAYGLNGSVFTTDLERGLSLARRIRTGTVELNGNPVGRHAPVGGFKQSGIGREFGPEGFDSYVELKSIGLPASLAQSLS
ncbi:aldehyde dehydrogenase [Streptomyces sp. NPDC001027]|uniref:aldehyde dehydrogenase n=1 Tax=Streptomyces sp. NPDC001027 TaxID=3154771 RepID=UPI0033178DBA